MAVLPRPLICLVTDRRRLGNASEDSLVRLVARASLAGVNLVHVRERDLDDRHLLALVRRIVSAVDVSTAVVVNDRADVALAAGAAGVHLRSDSAPADRVRPLVPSGFLIGRSVHGAAEARAAANSGVDYLVMGTTYPTSSKEEGVPLAGIRGLGEACQAVRIPVLAIGGVTADNVTGIAAAGAAGVAAIGLFSDVMADDSSGRVEAALRRAIERIRRSFDT
ncbi:MAG: thiamine phosphate synthase [Vicinamibacterales bacterium]